MRQQIRAGLLSNYKPAVGGDIDNVLYQSGLPSYILENPDTLVLPHPITLYLRPAGLKLAR